MVEVLKQARSICSTCGDIFPATYEVRVLTRGRSAVLPHIGTDPSFWTSRKTLTLFVKPFMDESAFVPLPPRRVKPATITAG